MIENLTLGLSVAMTIHNLGFAFHGCMVGTAIGVLSGIGPLATIALLLPADLCVGPDNRADHALRHLLRPQYGGSTSAILLNLLGEVTAVVTTLAGHKMAKRGRAGAALATAALGSFFAGTVATLAVAASGEVLTNLALSFGPAEYFSLILPGLIIATVLAQGSIFKSIAMASSAPTFRAAVSVSRSDFSNCSRASTS